MLLKKHKKNITLCIIAQIFLIFALFTGIPKVSAQTLLSIETENDCPASINKNTLVEKALEYQLKSRFIQIILDEIKNESEANLPQVIFSEVSETVYSTASLNLRTGPGTDYEKCGCLPKGEDALRIGIGDNGWSKLTIGETTYYASSKYLSLTKPAPYENPYPDFIKKDGNVEDIYVAIVAEEFASIYNFVAPLFKEKCVAIYITDKDLDDYFFNGAYGSVQGCFDTFTNAVYIEDRKKACTEAVVHECGHVYDWYSGNLSNTEEFSTLYQKEKEAFLKIASKHAVSNTCEYFAESFYFYFKNEYALKTNCPQTHAYLNNLLKKE